MLQSALPFCTEHLVDTVRDYYVIDTVHVFLPKCPLTTGRSRFNADEIQIG